MNLIPESVRKFRAMRDASLREFAQTWPEEYEAKARESGSPDGRGIELVQRISDQPVSVRPRGVGFWRAAMEFFGRGNEALAAAEVPNLLGTSMLKEIAEQMVNWEPVALQFMDVDETSKLETDAPRPMLSQLPNLVEVPSGEPPPKAPLNESNINVQVAVNKLAVEIMPKTLINDDKGVFSGLMDRLLLTCRTSLDKAAALQMQTPGNSGEDAQAFFSANYHLNTGTTALTLNDTGANTTLMAAWLAMVQQCDNSASIGSGVRTGGKILGLRPKFLVTAPTLYPKAKALCTHAQVQNDALTALVENQFAGLGITPIMFDYYPDTTDWFLLADPSNCPAFKIVFLNGRTLPTIRSGWNASGVVLTNFLRDDGTPLYPLHVEVDFPFKVNTFDFRGIYGGIVAAGT